MRAWIASLVTLCCVGLWCADADAAPRAGWPHEHAADRAAHHPSAQRLTLATEPTFRWTAATGPLEKMVYGYLPYWEMGYEVPNWELLGILAWFGVGIDASGQVVDWNGWGGAETEALVEDAHANHTPVAVTITLFDNAAIDALLQDPAAREQAIETCLEVMAVHGADGVNIDFEFVPGSSRDAFVTFMADLKLAVMDAQPNGGDGHVTLAGPAVDWTEGYDYDALLAVTDGIMVMGYGYHYGGGDPGPNAPLFGGGIWGPYSVAWTIDDYLSHGGDSYRDRIFFGLPWYGRRWPVANTAVPGISLGTGKAVWFDVALSEAAQYGATYDVDSHTPYYHKESDGVLWQVWYDDVASFGEKLAYIDDQGLGGIGLWALGYEGDEAGYWAAIAEQFTASIVAPPDEVEFPDAGATSPTSDVVSEEVDSTGPEEPEVGPEFVEPSRPESTTRAEVSEVSQTMVVREVSSEGCQGSGRSPRRNWWGLIVALTAIGGLWCRRAG